LTLSARAIRPEPFALGAADYGAPPEAGHAESGRAAATGAGPQAVAVAQLAGMSVTWHTWLERDLAHLAGA
jgi:hypothetical protein